MESIVFAGLLKSSIGTSPATKYMQYFMQKEYCTKTKKKISELEFGNQYYTITTYDEEGRKIFYKRYNLTKNTELIKNLLYKNDISIEVQKYKREKSLIFNINSETTNKLLKLLKNERPNR